MKKIDCNITEEIASFIMDRCVAEADGFPIDTYNDLVQVSARLAYINKDYILFFRGQKEDYLNEENKSTFYPTIYRGESISEEELSLRFDRLEYASKKLVELFKKENIHGIDEVDRKKYIQWSILQHYEVVQTPLIDVTQSLRVACSFAQLDNKNEYSYVYVFALPYLTNRISSHSEHNLVNIRLLSISPPEALRPYFQEGYLVGTNDKNENKQELDLNNRLVAKFKIPNIKSFWNDGFSAIPFDSLYPQNDKIHKLCSKINSSQSPLQSLKGIDRFLHVWADIENDILKKARSYQKKVQNLNNAITILKGKEPKNFNLWDKILDYRKFRNKLVHNPSAVSSEELKKKCLEVESLKRNQLRD